MKRVECDKCKNFIPAVIKDKNNIFAGIKTKAKCKLGKRVMFRLPTKNNSAGYYRYCEDYNALITNYTITTIDIKSYKSGTSYDLA